MTYDESDTPMEAAFTSHIRREQEILEWKMNGWQ